MSEESEDILPDIPELDIAGALRRVAGNKKLYLKILNSFVQNQKDSPTQIRALVNEGEIAKAEQIAHNIKGVVGNLGHTTLHKKMIELDSALKENKDLSAINKYNDEFEGILNDFIQKIAN